MKRLLIIAACALFVAQTACASGIEKLNRYVETTHAIRADFMQFVMSKSGKRPQQSSGEMSFSRPGKFRWQIIKPYSQLLVGDGEKVWIYDPDLRQVTVKQAGAAIGGTPAALLSGEIGNKGALEKNFSLREAGESEGMEWVEATPKSADSGFDKMRLGFDGNDLKAMELFDNFGQTTSLHFLNIERNPSIAASQFRFTPPAGVDVLGE